MVILNKEYRRNKYRSVSNARSIRDTKFSGYFNYQIEASTVNKPRKWNMHEYKSTCVMKIHCVIRLP